MADNKDFWRADDKLDERFLTHKANFIKLMNEHSSLEMNSSQAKKVFDQMREIHGCSVYDNYELLEYVKKVNPKNISQEGWIAISNVDKIIGWMRKVIFKIHKFSKGYVPHKEEWYDDKRHTKSYNDEPLNLHAVVKNKPNGDTVLSIKGLETEENYKPDDSILRSSEIFEMKGGAPPSGFGLTEVANGDVTLTEYIDNMSEETAKKLNDIYENRNKYYEQAKNQFSAENIEKNKDKMVQKANQYYDKAKDYVEEHLKPTVVYYWGDWCPYSVEFNKHWKEFKDFINNNVHAIRTAEIHVARDDVKANRLAAQAGVEGFPTAIVYVNDRAYPIKLGSRQFKDLIEFLKEKIKVAYPHIAEKLKSSIH